jgi:DNA-binding transcriptional LysR family regulator
MELRQLKYFIAVAEELHFGHAAEKLHVTTSALSQQIQLLESELEVDLFNQSKRVNFRRVELTEAGVVFLEDAKKTIKQSEIAIQNARNAHKKEQIIRLGIFRNILPQRVERIMELFSTHFPNVKMSLLDYESGLIVQEAVNNNSVDIGLSLLPLKYPYLECAVYDKTYFGILMNKQHPLAIQPTIKLKELTQEKWLDYGRGVNAYNQKIEKACQEAGFSREANMQQVVPSIDLLKRWVDLNKGIAFMPLALDISKDENLVLKNIINDNGTPFTNIIIQNVLAYKKETATELIKSLVELVEKTYCPPLSI